MLNFFLPIFRYGNEENLVTMMGLMQAIVSFVQDNKDNIKLVLTAQKLALLLVTLRLISTFWKALFKWLENALFLNLRYL